MQDLKIQWLNKIPPKEQQNPELFYYDLRDGNGNSYTIERKVLVDNIGSIATNKDILGNNEFITDKEFSELHFKEVQDLYVEQNSNELEEAEIE